MNTFFSFVIKETKHILRDPRTVMILFGMPIVMMLLFGFAISTDIKDVRVVAVTSSMDVQTQKIIDRLGASEYFTITSLVSTPAEAEQLMRNQKADMAVVFAPGFANHKYDGTAGIQIITDAADPNTAIQESNYATQIIQETQSGMAMAINTKMLYNPQMLSTYNFVPGIMGLLLMLICALMTSVSIVREKEKGTMEVLLVSPVKPIMIIIAKAIPYLMLSFLILVCILLLSVYVLEVPLAGSLFWIFAISLVYILLALSLGLLISVVAQTQLVALLASAMVLMMPILLLSGMIYPVESMPKILQYISYIIPGQWYISAMRKLLIMGVDITSVLKETVVLCSMTVVLLTLALKKFKTGL
ncbi:MAG: ABC transporter permease [Prevotellaceae bacterium]|nr:ABC transporter permease [Prevotellaceae bacterium]